ncbi:hypothetical protein [Deferrisoma sp.]
MRHLRRGWTALAAALALAVAGCGGGGGGGGGGEAPATKEGVAVDHYVVGAVIQEVDASGNVLQESTPTDENGLFTFENPVTLGSTLRSKADARGTHNNLPYPGVLKRNVDTTAGRLVVSPSPRPWPTAWSRGRFWPPWRTPASPGSPRRT